MLHSICQQIWKTQQWPQDWNRSVFIPVPKKGNAKECSNYCTIALISHTSKVMLKILQARFKQYVNHELPDVQAGFRKGRGARDQIANICWIIKKAREFFFFSFIFISWRLITLFFKFIYINWRLITLLFFHLFLLVGREFLKNIYFWLLTMPKPLTVWITINCGKFWKRWEYHTTWPASWETCMHVGKEQLELDMEQQTGSK